MALIIMVLCCTTANCSNEWNFSACSDAGYNGLHRRCLPCLPPSLLSISPAPHHARPPVRDRDFAIVPLLCICSANFVRTLILNGDIGETSDVADGAHSSSCVCFGCTLTRGPQSGRLRICCEWSNDRPTFTKRVPTFKILGDLR
jgi:hypothetical protein